jgi:hypothetical protein
VGGSSRDMQINWNKLISRWVWRKRQMHIDFSKRLETPLIFYIFVEDAFSAFAGYSWALKGKDFWTSGTDQGCAGKNYWCSKNRAINNRNMSWSSTSDGDCISIKFSNGSQFSKTACSRNLSYICEVCFVKYIHRTTI